MGKIRPAALLALLAANVAAAEDKPLWELGAGVAAFSFPAYRGSDKQRHFLMPVPYFVYHGEFLKADRHGIRAVWCADRHVDQRGHGRAQRYADDGASRVRDSHGGVHVGHWSAHRNGGLVVRSRGGVI